LELRPRKIYETCFAIVSGAGSERMVDDSEVSPEFPYSTGQVPETVQGMAILAHAFLDVLGLARVDLLGFSLGALLRRK
jgi:pimeloyl-ACP methyl ester carboxylesterase